MNTAKIKAKAAAIGSLDYVGSSLRPGATALALFSFGQLSPFPQLSVMGR